MMLGENVLQKIANKTKENPDVETNLVSYFAIFLYCACDSTHHSYNYFFYCCCCRIFSKLIVLYG